jgi:hypothetical protein
LAKVTAEQLKDARNAPKASNDMTGADKYMAKLNKLFTQNIKEIEKFEKIVSKSFKVVNQNMQKEWEASVKNLGGFAKKVQEIEKKSYKERLTQVEEFEKRYLAERKKFLKMEESISRVTSIGSTLDSVLGVNLFGPLSKVVKFGIDVTKNMSKMGVGLWKFFQNTRDEGMKNAVSRTKMGKAYFTTKRAVQRVTKPVSAFLKRDVKSFLPGVKQNSFAGESEKKAKKQEQLETLNDRLESSKDRKKHLKVATEGNNILSAWWKWTKLWEIFKWGVSKVMDIGKALFSFGASFLKGFVSIAPAFLKSLIPYLGPVAIGLAVGGIIHKALDLIAKNISDKADETISALYDIGDKNQEMKEADRDLWEKKLGLSKEQNRTLTY